MGEAAGVVSTVLRNCAFDWEDAEDSLTRPGVLYSKKNKKFQDVSTVLCNSTFDWEDAEDSLTHPWVFYISKYFCSPLWLHSWMRGRRGQLDPPRSYLLWKKEIFQAVSDVFGDCTFDWEDTEDSLTRPGVLYSEKMENFKIFPRSSAIALLIEKTAWPVHEFFTLKNRKSFKMFPQSSVIALLTKRTLRTAWPVHEFFIFQNFSAVLCDCTLEW